MSIKEKPRLGGTSGEDDQASHPTQSQPAVRFRFSLTKLRISRVGSPRLLVDRTSSDSSLKKITQVAAVTAEVLNAIVRLGRATAVQASVSMDTICWLYLLFIASDYCVSYDAIDRAMDQWRKGGGWLT